MIFCNQTAYNRHIQVFKAFDGKCTVQLLSIKHKNMRKRTEHNSNGNFFTDEALVASYNIVKKTIVEYTDELMRRCRYKSIVSQVDDGVVMDDRSRLIDMYDSCYIQNAHLQGTIATLFSQLIGKRYMFAKEDKDGKWIRDPKQSRICQGSQFEKIIRAIVESELYGYSLIEIMPELDPETGLLKEVNSIERRCVLPDQRRVVQRWGQWTPGWDLDSEQYRHNYILVNNGGFGLFAATTPNILAQKYTLSNWVNFSHTYGQPIIHGKTGAEDNESRSRLARKIASAAQNKVLVTGKEDEIDIKAFTMSNSEKIYESLANYVNKENDNLILGSESMAGGMQSYVGSTKAHENIYRARINAYRTIVENVMNEQVVPVLRYWGIISDDVYFKYMTKVEMSDENKIKLFDMLTNKYEIDPEEINKEWGIEVGQQRNFETGYSDSTVGGWGDDDDNDGHRMSDEEYYKRYGHHRDAVNFLSEVH